ncbi:MAG: hypothetical protein V7677_10465 [Motiliproteus sp.]
MDDNEAPKNPFLRWLVSDSKLAMVTGWILFIVSLGILFNGYVFISEWLGLPWNSKGY